jgi:ectoine hydroxylase-related dioxygenase (phytanoyl-CoA dioxygenase family)
VGGGYDGLMRLSEDGYEIERAVLSHKECDALIAALSEARRSRAGVRHLMRNPAVAEVAADPRLLAVAKAALGVEAIPYRATLFEKAGKANWLVPWHRDTALPLEASFDAPGWGPWSEKEGILYAHAPAWALSKVIALRVHLDASTTKNGPLRVVPGSHHARIEIGQASWPVGGDTECVVPKGGVLAMRPLIIHAFQSSKLKPAPRASHRIRRLSGSRRGNPSSHCLAD